MKKTFYEFINHRGEKVVNDTGICPDGFGVKVPTMLMDAAPPRTNIVDAFGGTAGNRPGYVFSDGGPNAESIKAYDAMTQRLSDAWKLTPMPPGYINERSGKYEANATGEAVEGRQFYTVSEQDGTTNARDAAYAAHVRILSEQWRTR